MTKKIVDYAQTCIYLIRHSIDANLSYVGFTTNFIKRRAKHKQNCKEKAHIRLYKTINENGGWQCFNMIQIKTISCINKREAELEEEKCRIEYNANLNSHKCFVDTILYKKEWYQQNKERILKDRKDKYHTKNEIIIE
jgi:predicted GIY-YIG superfamily endonuclease